MTGIFPWGRPAGCLVLLISTTTLSITQSPAAAIVAMLAVAGLLGASLRPVAASPTGRFALGQAAVAIVITVAHGHVDGRAAVAGMKFAGVASFLICTPLYANLFRTCGLDAALLRRLRRVAGGLRTPALLLCAVVSALGLSFGTIPVYGSAMKPRSRPATAALARGVVISMLVAPTTGSVAAVMSVFPELGLPAILSATLPVAAIAFGLACLFGHGAIDVSPTGGQAIKADPRLVGVVGGLVVGLSLAGLPLLPAIAWTAIIAHFLWHRAAPGGLSQGAAVLRETFSGTSMRLAPEILLFVATGWLAWALASMDLSVGGFGPSLGFLRPLLPTLLLGVMSVAAVAGIHPMVAFGVLHPLSSKIGTGLPAAGEYTVWVVGFVLAMLVAPVSVLTTISSVTSGFSPWQASVALHLRYALALTVATVAYVALRFQ